MKLLLLAPNKHVYIKNFYTASTVLFQGLLEMLDPSEVFACESGAMFLHQEENFFLAVGMMNFSGLGDWL